MILASTTTPTRAPAPNEEAIHRAVVDLLERAAKAGVVWTHFPAGEHRSKAVGGKLRGLGTKPGWPDLIFLRAGQFYGLEMKATRGRPSRAQMETLAAIGAAGGDVAITYGLDEAIAKLREWELVR
jgi:hypothetical protein